MVLPDGIGEGGSTKPSGGMRARFPRYGYIDQVEAQHAMLKGMGIEHLKLVAGVSQGGMQTWVWGEHFPDAMDALAPVASMPVQVSGRNPNAARRSSSVPSSTIPIGTAATTSPRGRRHGGRRSRRHCSAVMVSNPQRLQEAGPDRARTLADDDQLATQWSGHDGR